MPDNFTTEIGRLGADPELRFLESGNPATEFSIAVRRSWTDRATQEKREETSWFDCKAYGKLAENIAESFQKGDRIIVIGRLNQRSWETQEGQKRSVVEIVCDDAGPSVRWDTCEVDRSQRGQHTQADGNGQQPAAATVPAGGSESGEEPF